MFRDVPNFFFFFGYVYLCVEGGGGLHAKAHVWRSEDYFRSWFFTFIMWVLGIKLRTSSLAASTFTYWAILWPHLPSYWKQDDSDLAKMK